MLIPLSLLIITSAVLHLRAEYHKNQTQIHLFKPLTTTLIIVLALLASNPPTPFYKTAVIIGLTFSLLGDIFLMLPNKFLPGLISFLIAHLFYIAAFASAAEPTVAPVTEPVEVELAEAVEVLPFLLYGTAVYAYLYPTLGKMKLPALLYMLAIITMAWQALNHWQHSPDPKPALLAFLGALLFVASDTLLALNRFRRPLPAAQLLIMSTYVTAQYLIALSISR